MKLSKRAMICLLLIFTMCLSVSASELSNEQLETLSDYNIFQGDENGNLHLDELITRAEFCKVICSALGFNDMIPSDSMNQFKDVNDQHWACNYIECAYTLNLISGTENGYFMPDDTISNIDVIKTIISALGYEPKAARVGGYPNGYVTIAKELNLISSNALNLDQSAIRKDVALLLSIALDIPVMKQTGFGDTIEYSVMNGEADNQLITLKSNLDQ